VIQKNLETKTAVMIELTIDKLAEVLQRLGPDDLADPERPPLRL
jgi:hypothetical protein